MSQILEDVDSAATMDPFEIGWYIESADEEIYGPVSRKTLRQYLEEDAISPNTLVRHCSQPEAKPVVDQPGVADQMVLEGKGAALGDRMEEVWPRKKRDQLALAEDSLPCAWHKKPAVLVCVRCHAPYCNKCRAKPFRKQFFLCRRCQVGMHNRRFGALIVDTLVLVYVPMLALGALIGFTDLGRQVNPLLLNAGLQLLTLILLFGRDAFFGGSGIGKRMSGLQVVKTRDGTTPLGFGQGIVRWLSQLIPFFNIADAIKPYYDPLLRRYGDQWASTRVIDREARLAKDRAKIAKRLLKKGIQPPPDLELTMTGLAQLA